MSGERKTVSEDDLRFVQENYLTMPISEVASHLGRTEKAVMHIAAKLGIKKVKNWDFPSVGEVINGWTVIEIIGDGCKTKFKCQAESGVVRIISKDKIRNPPDVNSLKKDPQIGDKINKLTVISEKFREKNKTYAMFRCDCGTEKKICLQSVKNEKIKSCGCYNREAAAERCRQSAKHGLIKHPLYQSWASTKTRCYNKNYEGYLGVEMDEDWINDFMSFYNWAISKWFEGAVITRIDKDRGFYPDNCTFVTRGEACKDNFNIEKAKETRLSKYGVEHYVQTEEYKERVKTTSMKKYGVEHHCLADSVVEKKNKTNLERYGGNPLSNESVKDKIKKTNIEKYGADHPMKNKDVARKLEESNIEKYGVKSTLMLDDVKEKIKATNLEKYGYENPLSSPEIRDKANSTTLKNHGYVFNSEEMRARSRESLIKKYGSASPRKIPGVNEKIAKTNLERYGVENPWMSKDVQEKCIETKVERYGEYFTSGAEEKSFGEFLSKYAEFHSDWKLISPKQIDFYSEDLKIGFEYCGIFWHNECSPSPRGRKYHIDKYLKCKELGVRLITVWSDEWMQRRKQVENFISSIFSSKKIYGRKCLVIELDKSTAINFINDNHIRPITNIVFAYGLIHNQELVGCMSFSKHPRDSKKITMSRMCFSSGVTVVGGASKLLKQSIDKCSKLGYKEIVTWSENRWSEGDVYNKIGFVLDGELGPDYSYVNKDGQSRVSKQSCKKKNIKCPDGMTESEYMKSLGVYRIWDCGKKRWKIDVK